MVHEYTHDKMNEEVDAISGHYAFNKEVRLPFHKREILYLVGCAVVDKSCCGPGGCAYALVPGYILSWKPKVDDRGMPISEIEPISDEPTRRELIQLIQHAEIVNQVQFW
jgi:hypothetical protein